MNIVEVFVEFSFSLIQQYSGSSQTQLAALHSGEEMIQDCEDTQYVLCVSLFHMPFRLL